MTPARARAQFLDIKFILSVWVDREIFSARNFEIDSTLRIYVVIAR